MPVYTKKTTKNGTVQYRDVTNNRLVGVSDLSTAIKEELDLANEGTQIDSETVTQGEGDGQTNADGSPIGSKDDDESKAEAARVKSEQDALDAGNKPARGVVEEDTVPLRFGNPYRSEALDTSKGGFGFPRKNGKTVDIFDQKTPHTHLRHVAGLNVPLSEENYRTKEDAQIYDRLVELDLV